MGQASCCLAQLCPQTLPDQPRAAHGGLFVKLTAQQKNISFKVRMTMHKRLLQSIMPFSWHFLGIGPLHFVLPHQWWQPCYKPSAQQSPEAHTATTPVKSSEHACRQLLPLYGPLHKHTIDLQDTTGPCLKSLCCAIPHTPLSKPSHICTEKACQTLWTVKKSCSFSMLCKWQ